MLTLKQIYLARPLRERFLFALTFGSLLLLWALSLMDAAAARWQTYSLNQQVLSSFNDTLEQESTARNLLTEARQQVDQSKTFSAAQLGGRIDSIARNVELPRFDVRTPATVETDLFSFHNVRVRITRAQLEELIRFDLEVKKLAPYIAMADFRLTANNRDPRYLDADFELVSFELKEDALND